MKFGGIWRKAGAWAAASALASGAAWANPQPWQLNLTSGVTDTSRQVYGLHMLAFWVCVGIGVVVFGAMIVAMVRFRKSKGAVAETWSHNTKLELVWTVIPVLILISLAWPATRTMIRMTDTSGADMTVKITAYQWKWRYDYVDYQGKPVNRVGFISKLDSENDRVRQLGSGLDPWSLKSADGFDDYLLNVDHPLVLPAGVKVRFVITADDVIHAWWVPQLGWKQDAIPGIVNSQWTQIDEPGIYRGQCAELCGQDHGFMPIVVKAVPKAEFEQWLTAQEAASAVDQAAHTAQTNVPTPAGRG
ncbi:MAG: cytochrome c oxidase subunit II [Mizugakiibacter sp.]|uniref:cytochrome c oxidase subunit II n=1 Tax=Mizugakiibacter sp. TaxID=1972610 RepID=UPI0031CA4145|nr:cytochrome c oxidase subunit II [Xanthomonadaceae bacterium]